MTINVEPTASVIDEIADTLENYAMQMRRYAEQMRKRNDISYAAEAASGIGNCFNNLRIDLLVMRPIRELQKEE